jgi:predicted ATPase
VCDVSSKDRALVEVEHAATTIALDRLEGAQMQDMSVALLGGNTAEDVATFIEDRTGGNPLFIEEVIRELVERLGAKSRTQHPRRGNQ